MGVNQVQICKIILLYVYVFQVTYQIVILYVMQDTHIDDIWNTWPKNQK